ncbi:MAG: polysaccharide deacetylase family protein [Verrucomicrobiota bacterium]
MTWATLKSPPSRAVTPLFRALRLDRERVTGEAKLREPQRGMDRVELIVLAVLVPLVMAGAVFDGLWRLGGAWVACLGVFPGLWLIIHVLCFGIPAGSPRAAVIVWGGMLTAWSMWILGWGGTTPLIGLAWIWLAFVTLQFVGLLLLGWQVMMSVQGDRGLWLRVAIAVAAHALLVLVWWRCGTPWGLVCGFSIVATWAIGTFLPGNCWFGPVAKQVEGGGPLLTIDDGPDPDDTPAILDLLDEHGVKAVFFVIGEKVREFPDLAREIVARGHELGNHTMTHPQHGFWIAGPRRTKREIVEGSKAIEDVTGVKPRWFRAPVGHRNFFTHPVVEEMRMEVVAWNRRGFDTTKRPVEAMVADLTDGVDEQSILLLHEGTEVAGEVVAGVLKKMGRAAL